MNSSPVNQSEKSGHRSTSDAGELLAKKLLEMNPELFQSISAEMELTPEQNLQLIAGPLSEFAEQAEQRFGGMGEEELVKSDEFLLFMKDRFSSIPKSVLTEKGNIIEASV